MVEIKFITKDAASNTRIEKAFKDLYSILQVPVDTEDLTKGTKPQYTDAEFVRVKVIEYIEHTVKKQELSAAKQAVTIDSTKDIIN